MNRKALVTGATGFVGSHVAESFAAAGYDLRCTVRSSSDPKWLRDLEPELFELDLSLAADYAGAVEGVDTVIHSGGITRARTDGEYLRVNADATERLAAAAADAGVRRFVFISSIAARGPDGRHGPTSAYGESKVVAEDRLRDIADSMPVVVLRPAGVYGPRDSDLLPLFKMAKHGLLAAPAGSALLQPVYATDVASAALQAAEVDSGFGPFPVAERGKYAWRDVARMMEEAVGRKIRMLAIPTPIFESTGLVSEVVAKLLGKAPELDRRRAQDLARYAWTTDIATTERALDWIPAVPLREGLALTAKWYRSVGWL